MKRHLGPLLKLMLLLAFLSRLEFVFGQANYELMHKASATGTVGGAVQSNSVLNQSSSMSNSIGAERLQLKVSPKVFSSNTDLSFMLKQDGKYKLEILNMQGIIVTVLAEGNGLAGEMLAYQLRKGQYAAGGYIARLITNNEITSTRFMLE